MSLPGQAFEICQLHPSKDALQKWHYYSKPRVDALVRNCQSKIAEGKNAPDDNAIDGLVNCVPDQFEDAESSERADFIAPLTLHANYYDSETGDELSTIKAWHQYGACAGSRVRRSRNFETIVFGSNGNANGEVVVRTRNGSAPLKMQSLHLRFLTPRGKPDIAKAQAFVRGLNSTRRVTIGFVEGTADEDGIIDYPNFRVPELAGFN
jgi:hypothetical protein